MTDRICSTVNTIEWWQLIVKQPCVGINSLELSPALQIVRGSIWYVWKTLGVCNPSYWFTINIMYTSALAQEKINIQPVNELLNLFGSRDYI